MIKKITLWCLLLLCLLSGCARQVFYFPANTGASVSYQKARQEQEAIISGIFSPADSAGLAGNSPGLASLEELEIAAYQASPEARNLGRHLSAAEKGYWKAAGKPHHQEAVKKNNKREEKKLQDEEKKTTKLGKAGFILSLIGLGSLLLVAATGVFFFLGFIAAVLGIVFSGIALSEIKKAPEQYKDRPKARAGLILGIVALIFYLGATLFLLAYAGAI